MCVLIAERDALRARVAVLEDVARDYLSLTYPGWWGRWDVMEGSEVYCEAARLRERILEIMPCPD